VVRFDLMVQYYLYHPYLMLFLLDLLIRWVLLVLFFLWRLCLLMCQLVLFVLYYQLYLLDLYHQAVLYHPYFLFDLLSLLYLYYLFLVRLWVPLNQLLLYLRRRLDYLEFQLVLFVLLCQWVLLRLY
jgi:hypothetical protein